MTAIGSLCRYSPLGSNCLPGRTSDIFVRPCPDVGKSGELHSVRSIIKKERDREATGAALRRGGLLFSLPPSLPPSLADWKMVVVLIFIFQSPTSSHPILSPFLSYPRAPRQFGSLLFNFLS